MWKNICNISSAVADLAVIVGKEISHQFDNVSEATEGVTSTLATKASTLRAEYEQSLADRKSGVVKPTVVTDVPEDAVHVN